MTYIVKTLNDYEKYFDTSNFMKVYLLLIFDDNEIDEKASREIVSKGEA